MQVNQAENKELISIVIPVYNVEAYLRKCFDSILSQTYSEFEAILINDGSTDGSLAICNEYAEKDNRFIVVNQPNKGVSAARNSGLSIAKGAYITFLDSDDTIDCRYLEILRGNLVEASADISMCTWHCEGDTRHEAKRNIEIWDAHQTFWNLFRYKKIDGSVCSKLYGKECIDGLLFDEKLKIGEDQIFAIKAIEKAGKVVFQDIPLYTYYIRNTSAMNSSIDSRYWDIVYRAEWLVAEAKKSYPELYGLFRKEELNIYVTMIIRDIKGRTEESKKIVEYIWPNVKKGKCREYYKYSSKYEFLRFVIIKYFCPVASLLIKIKNK